MKKLLFTSIGIVALSISVFGQMPKGVFPFFVGYGNDFVTKYNSSEADDNTSRKKTTYWTNDFGVRKATKIREYDYNGEFIGSTFLSYEYGLLDSKAEIYFEKMYHHGQYIMAKVYRITEYSASGSVERVTTSFYDQNKQKIKSE
jgi:hypothetical protein